MRQITVRYHNEAGTWWAESPDLAGFSAAAATRDDLATLIREGVAFALDDAPHMILEARWTGQSHSAPATRAASPVVPVTPQVGYRTRRTPSYLSTNPRLALT